MRHSSKLVVKSILEGIKTDTILDAPCGLGWLREYLEFDCTIDGVDLYDSPKDGYRQILQQDLDDGLPDTDQRYECICCCEGIEHFGNPLKFMTDARELLTDKGLFVITTPNIWNPASKLQFFTRGFFPGFACLAGKIERGTHMHITPWNFSQLYFYLTLAGFTDIELHEEELSKPKHIWEIPLAIPQKIYAKGKLKNAANEEERAFWEICGSDRSVYSRHLIVTAKKKS